MQQIYNADLKRIFYAISNINKTAYKDNYLLTNQILGKNLSISQIYNILNKKKRNHKSIKVVLKLFKYYINSSIWFFWYLLIHLLYRISTEKDINKDLPHELIVIDTYFIIKKYDRKNYKEKFLTGLPELLSKLNKKYYYLPLYYGSINPILIREVIRNIEKQGIETLSEFQLLNLNDLIDLGKFYLSYPFHLLKLLKKYKSRNDIEQGIVDELFNSIDKVVTSGYCRFLHGKKIAQLNVNKIKILGWFENQVISKCLYKGLRSNKKNVEIIGAQLMAWPIELIHFYPDDIDYYYGLMPNKILVNGQFYLPRTKKYNYSVGPSLRYRHLFNAMKQNQCKEYIIVLLPYFDKQIMRILELVNKLPVAVSSGLMIKFHPTTKKQKYKKFIPANSIVTNEDLEKILDRAQMVIGSSTGAILEAICLGVPGIIIRSKNEINYNYIPPIGRYQIWDFASTYIELQEMIYKYNKNDYKMKDTHKKLAIKIRDTVFCNPTDKKIIEAFELE